MGVMKIRISTLCIICMGFGLAMKLMFIGNPFPVPVNTLLLIMVAHKLSWFEVFILEILNVITFFILDFQVVIMLEDTQFLFGYSPVLFILSLAVISVFVDKSVNWCLPKKWKLNRFGY